jgi:hypothetical protein
MHLHFSKYKKHMINTHKDQVPRKSSHILVRMALKRCPLGQYFDLNCDLANS